MHIHTRFVDATPISMSSKLFYFNQLFPSSSTSFPDADSVAELVQLSEYDTETECSDSSMALTHCNTYRV